MIKSVKIEGFKSFYEETLFPLSSINLLTGINGRGKSTFLQVLLLCKQSIDHASTSECNSLVLNGECVQLGSFDDIRNSLTSQREHIHFKFKLEDEIENTLRFRKNEDDDMVADLALPFPSELKFLDKIHFVAADRVGPQQFYLRKSLPNFMTVGTRGEYVGNVLFHKRTDLVHDSLYIKTNNKSQELIIQAGEWISNILDVKNLKIDVQDVGNGVLILSFQFGNDEKKYKPSNVGFGYTYVLPIVVAGLIAKPGDTLIVENPEAHLHPKAQSKLTEFLTIVSNSGIQVFIESHSEHILNALRVQVALEHSSLSSSDVSVLFFPNDEDVRVKQIPIDSDGGIDIWYEDFFDQTEKDLKTILGF